MRLLVVAPMIPFPSRDGIRLLIAEPLRLLAEQGDTMTLVAPADGASDLSPFPGLTLIPVAQGGRAAALLRSWSTGAPDAAARICTPRLLTEVERLLRSGGFDLLHLEHQATAPCGTIARRLGIPCVLRQHNVEHDFYAGLAALAHGPRRAHYRLQSALARRAAARLSQSVDLCLALSPEDACALRALDPALRVELLPAGVELPAQRPPGSAAATSDGRARIVFVGHMGYAANIDAVCWFCEEIWPQVRCRLPDAGFAIVGRSPAPAVARLAALPGVTVTGTVEEVAPWLAQAQVVVAPLRQGAGVRIKLLHALAAGRAIVATRAAAAGLELRDGRDLRLADDAASFAAAVLELLTDAPARAALEERAYLCAARFDRRALTERQRALYTALLSTPAPEP